MAGTRSTTAEIPASVFPDGPATVIAPATLVEGQPLTVSLSGVGDPSAADVAAGFSYAFDLGAGLSAFGPATSAADPSARNGTRTVRAQVRDKDGEISTYIQVIPVANVAPAVSAPGGDATVGRGQVFARAGTFADPGNDGYNDYVDYGEGAGPTPLILRADKSFALNHVFRQSGVFHVSVAVNDGGGGGGSTTFKVTAVAPNDLNRDGKTDLVVYRPSTGQFLAQRSTAGPLVANLGSPNLDQPVIGDYDGDGKADLAVYRSQTSQWLILKSGGGVSVSTLGGGSGDVPASAAVSYSVYRRADGVLRQCRGQVPPECLDRADGRRARRLALPGIRHLVKVPPPPGPPPGKASGPVRVSMATGREPKEWV